MTSRKTGPVDVSRATACRKRIMLVDDHPLIRQGLAALIQSKEDLAVSAEAGSAEEVLQALAQDVPDLLVLDISIPGVHGLDLLKDLRIRYPALPVLVLSMHEERVYAERALRAGAQGYIMKQKPGAKVLEAIRCVLRGELYVSKAIVARSLKRFVSNKAGSDKRTDIEKLSDRELQVFTHIGNGMSTKKIAELLRLSSKTIQTYRELIKRKLGLRSATELVYHATHWVKLDAGHLPTAPQG